MSAFGAVVPESFATFDVAFFTLLLVTAGEPWPDALPRLNPDGSANWVVMAFCGCYIIVSTWLVLQVPRPRRRRTPTAGPPARPAQKHTRPYVGERGRWSVAEPLMWVRGTHKKAS